MGGAGTQHEAGGKKKAGPTALGWSRPTGSTDGAGREDSPAELADQWGEVEVQHDVDGAGARGCWNTDWWWQLVWGLRHPRRSRLSLRSGESVRSTIAGPGPLNRFSWAWPSARSGCISKLRQAHVKLCTEGQEILHQWAGWAELWLTDSTR